MPISVDLDENQHLAADAVTACFGGTTCTILYSPQNYLRVTTGSCPYDDGVINVFVKSGNGLAH